MPWVSKVLLSKAFLKTAAAEKAVHGFQSCGLWPYNANKFTEEHFAAAVTEEADPTQSLQGCPAADTTTNLEDASVRKETGEPGKTVPEVDAQVRVPNEAAANQACMPTQVNDAGKVGPEEDAYVQVQVLIETVTNEECLQVNDVGGIEPEEDAQVQVQVQKPLKGNMKVITTTGDGNCFFHSIATALHVNLQVWFRDGNGVPQDPHCKLLENAQSTNLGTRMAAFMKKNSDEYEDMDQDVLN